MLESYCMTGFVLNTLQALSCKALYDGFIIFICKLGSWSIKRLKDYPLSHVLPVGSRNRIWNSFVYYFSPWVLIHLSQYYFIRFGYLYQNHLGCLMRMVICGVLKGLLNQNLSIKSFSSVQFGSLAQSCPTLCDPMNHSTPGLPVHHHLPEFTQTHVLQVGDAIQPSHPLSSPSPFAFNLSQHQNLFQWVIQL